MNIQVKQKDPVTLVRMCGGELIGVSSCRPTDRFDSALGLAVAIVKANKRIPENERHFLDELEDVTWDTLRIREQEFGEMVAHMIGYRTAIGDYPLFPSKTLDDRVLGVFEYLVALSQRPPDCVLAERMARQLLDKAISRFLLTNKITRV
jgi:hypothetical protein